MSLASEAEQLESMAALPSRYQPHAEIDGDDGTAATGLVDGTLIGSDDDLLKLANLDPAEWVVTNAKKQIWTKETAHGVRRSIFFGFTRRTPERERIAHILASKIQPLKPALGQQSANGEPLVICFADLQTGKADEKNGGTPELIDRFHTVLGQLVDIAAAENPRTIAICDLGDICEGWSNHTSISQASTNDITQSEQLRVARRLITEAIVSLAPYAGRTIVSGVDSNHAAERMQNGMQNRHGDWGLENLRGIRDAFELLETDLEPEFIIPEPLESGAFIDIEGLHVALTHGHDAKRIENMGQWLANQAALPGSRYATSNVLIHGHYHHFAASESRHRLILGCPALESGSNWLTRMNGEESNPGVLTFRVKDQKLHGLRIIEP